MAFFTHYLSQFDLDEVLSQLFSKFLSLFLLWGLFLLAKRMVRFSVQKIVAPSLKLSSQDYGRRKTILRLVENILNYVLYFIVAYTALAVVGLPVSSLLAGAGIAGIAIGMGAQGFLSDLVNGFFILVERQFDVGDSVRLTNGPIAIAGAVVSVGIRTTQLRDADGTLHFIPNRNILVVSNQSRGDMRVQIDIPLDPIVDLEKVTQAIEELHQRELGHYPDIKGCTILGPHNTATGQFSYRVQFFVTSGQQRTLYHTFYRLYQETLLQAGISLPTTGTK